MKNTLLDIEILALFFYNFSQDDIKELCLDWEFSHFWTSKRFSFTEDTNVQLWMGFSRYFGIKTKERILEKARARYQSEAERRFEIT